MGLINKRSVRKIILDLANSKHPADELTPDYTDSTGKVWSYARANSIKSSKKYTQVSISLLEEIDTQVRVLVAKYIDKAHLTGKTVSLDPNVLLSMETKYEELKKLEKELRDLRKLIKNEKNTTNKDR